MEALRQKVAVRTMLGLLAGIVLFHVCILVKIIPYEVTWGGRLQNDSEMVLFETISIAVNLFLISILLIKGRYLKEWIPIKIVNMILWVFLVLFGLNTIGNVLAKTNFEKFFALVTLAFSILIWIILKKGKNSNTSNVMPKQ